MCAEALDRRKERERDKTAKKCAVRNFVTLTLKYNKAYVTVEVATSLVVNHVNSGVWYLYVVFVFMFMLKRSSQKIMHKQLIKETIIYEYA